MKRVAIIGGQMALMHALFSVYATVPVINPVLSRHINEPIVPRYRASYASSYGSPAYQPSRSRQIKNKRARIKSSR